jgi:hypothetical protein
MKFPQQAYDYQQNVGGGVIEVRRSVMNNPPDSPYFPTADDYGCLGWTLDPEDVLTAPQTAADGTIYGALVIIPNTVTVNRISFQLSAAPTTEHNYSGVGLYSANSALTTLSLLASSANQNWVGGSTAAITDAPFSAAAQVTPGYYWACWEVGFSAGTPGIHGATAESAGILNFSKNSGATAWRAFSMPSNTSMPATITLPGTAVKSAFTPFLVVS